MSASKPKRPNFDLVARPYRWLEYLTFGCALERCRLHFLPGLEGCRNALVIGDGDGRFLARLLSRFPTLHADAVDSSAAMLQLLRERCEREAPDAASRLHCYHDDVAVFAARRSEIEYDLVVTHFFLDCLDQVSTEALVAAVAERMAPRAIWITSDFRIPHGMMRVPARILVRTLYLAFRALTGLQTRRLPNHAAAFSNAGFEMEADRLFLGGILFSERWSRSDSPHQPQPVRGL